MRCRVSSRSWSVIVIGALILLSALQRPVVTLCAPVCYLAVLLIHELATRGFPVTMAALTFVALLLPVTGGADAVADVTLMKDGASVALSKAERAQIAERVRVLMVGCAITSVTEPGLFSARSLPKEWQEIRAGSHLQVRFPKPLEAKRGGVRISEVIMGLQDPNLIGPELSRHDGRVVGHVKCDGRRALAVMCATALRAHLLPGQSEACKIYDKMGEPRDRR